MTRKTRLKMKLLMTIFLLVIAGKIYSQDYVIKIEYPRNEDNTIWNNGIDEIVIKNNHQELKRFVSNKEGIIKIPKSFIDKSLEYDIFLTTIGISENYLTIIKNNTSDTLIFTFPKKYTLKSDYAICPKCNKSDKVCKISSEPILIMNFVDKDTLYTSIDENERIYYLGSSVWNEFNPKWFCIRDSIKF